MTEEFYEKRGWELDDLSFLDEAVEPYTEEELVELYVSAPQEVK
jgi:hypothetical protein